MLHAAVLRSPHAHARIARIETSRARSRPGVFAVLTGEDARQLSNPLPAFCAEPVVEYGVKGGGEGGRMIAPAAVASAVEDALAPFAVRAALKRRGSQPPAHATAPSVVNGATAMSPSPVRR